MAWNLPEDLDSVGTGLHGLTLTGSVDRVDWLPRSLETLSLSGTQVRRLDGLPTGLHTLELCNTPVAELTGVPENVRRLDLRFTDLRVVSGLPEGLDLLALGGERLERIDQLPASVESLEIAAAPRLQSPAPWRNGLRRLALEGADEAALASLPPTVEALSLTDASVAEIDVLPPHLKRLHLSRNAALEWVNLPPELEAIWIDRLDRSYFGALPDTLRSLTIQRSRIGAVGAWPIALRSLSLYRVAVSWEPPLPLVQELTIYGSLLPPALPANLSSLAIGDSSPVDDDTFAGLARAISGLSDTLTALTLDRLPPGLDLQDLHRLRRLEVSVTDGAVLDALSLPDGLEELAIHTAGAHLPALPTRLRRLDLTDSQGLDTESLAQVGGLPHLQVVSLRNTGIETLPALPESVRELDLSGTKIDRLDGLPAHLVRLTVHVGQLARLGTLPESVDDLRFVSADGQPACPDLTLIGWLDDAP